MLLHRSVGQIGRGKSRGKVALQHVEGLPFAQDLVGLDEYIERMKPGSSGKMGLRCFPGVQVVLGPR